MTTRRAFVLAAIAAAASGCASRRPVPQPSRGLYAVRGTENDVHRPGVGEVATVSVGDSIISHARQITTEVIRVSEPHTVVQPWPHDLRYSCAITIPAGTYTLAAMDRAGARYFAAGRRPLTWIYQGKPSHDDDALVDIKVDAGGSMWLAWVFPEEREVTEAAAPGLRAKFAREVSPGLRPKLRRELVYTGRAGSRVSLLYREFADDLARPAFSQALQYDIGADPVIGYQGARFRVLGASNTDITVEVLATLP